MKNCEYCKAAMNDDALKCPACGAHVKHIERLETGNITIEEPVKERMTKKQKGLLIASCIITFIALTINVFAAIVFGMATQATSSSDDNVGRAVMLIVFLPLWFIFGCTTGGISIIYNLCIIMPLGKKWFIPLIFAVVVAILLIVVIIELFNINTSSSTEETSAVFMYLLNRFGRRG